jgi:hypothetical protein
MVALFLMTPTCLICAYVSRGGTEAFVATTNGIESFGPLGLGSGALTADDAWPGINSFAGILECKNFQSVRCVDDLNSTGWAGSDIGAWVNSAIADLPSSGGIVYVTAPSAVSLLTTITDNGTKTTLLILGNTNITCDVQCVNLTATASSIRGIGSQSQMIGASTLPANIPLIYVAGTGSGQTAYWHHISGVRLIQGRNSNAGMLRMVTVIQSAVKNMIFDGSSGDFFTIGAEFLNGYSDEVDNVECLNSVGGICVGVTAQNFNTSAFEIRNVQGYNETAVAINYATSMQPGTTDSTTMDNILSSAGAEVPDHEGTTTVSGNQPAGLTSFRVVSGSECLNSNLYQVWIGSGQNSELDRVKSVTGNTLTLMFPTQQAHMTGERVLCGMVGIHIGANTGGTRIGLSHIQDEIPAIDCQDCQNLTIGRPYLWNNVVAPSGDGIRLDAARQVSITSPIFHGFVNPILITPRVPPWGGSTFGVRVLGYTKGTDNTHEGIVNDSGLDPYQYGIGCENVTGTDVSCPLLGPLFAAELKTTSATSDKVSIPGMVSSGHCSLTPTNASAASNIATTYISVYARNQITVTHADISGMTYHFVCTPY